MHYSVLFSGGEDYFVRFLTLEADWGEVCCTYTPGMYYSLAPTTTKRCRLRKTG